MLFGRSRRTDLISQQPAFALLQQLKRRLLPFPVRVSARVSVPASQHIYH